MSAAESFIAEALQSSELKKNNLSLSRGQVLTRVGDIERHIYWITSGAVRAVWRHGDEEHTIRFGYQGSFINSLGSYFTGNNSELSVEAIRKTEVVGIQKQDLEAFIAADDGRQARYRKLLELLAVQQMEREYDLLCSSPSERLRRVLQRSPQLFQEVPAKYIAAYLRMTPEHFSRLRREA